MTADLLLFVVVGFSAQMVDGALGMAYGVISTSVLMSFGVTPAVASASVHAAEVFTTGASAFSHWRLGNTDNKLFARLAIPGAFGGIIGAYVLAELPSDLVRPFVHAYLAAIGAFLLWKGLSKPIEPGLPRHVSLLGLCGGFLDAIGGGGWGALVTSTLAATGTRMRYAIGSTNAAEFVVTMTASATFVFTIGLELWPMITGLIIGGVVAAPFAAYMTRLVPDRPLMILVGIVILALSLRGMLGLFQL
jgi:uncharacterized membrane protein YfcA